ncbi:hypothetical protein V7200_14700 [Cytobacillus firmus]|uniref:Uncharacterized protein n=1 Tax=Cytobacillus firmus TaxID=1399 RepID=A0A800MWD6_CYTFI|nr:hypothetical protein [Cytobacillus firmus]KAF0823611.1 hypothetical protein KIS1582_2559 [Cytobacillus firmus]
MSKIKNRHKVQKERELVNEFGKYKGDQPVPLPNDYDEIEY